MARNAAQRVAQSSAGRATAAVGRGLRETHELAERGGAAIRRGLDQTPLAPYLSRPPVPGVSPGQGAQIAESFRERFGQRPEAIDVVGSRAEAQATGSWPSGSGPDISDVDIVITTDIQGLSKHAGEGFEFFSDINPGTVPPGITGIGPGPNQAYISNSPGSIPKAGTLDPFFRASGPDLSLTPPIRIWPTPISPPVGGLAGALSTTPRDELSLSPPSNTSQQTERTAPTVPIFSISF